MRQKVKEKLVFISLLLAVVFLATSAAAQVSQTGAIRGYVTDEEGQPLPGVSVTISGPALIGKMTSITTVKGAFRAISLPPGRDYVAVCDLDGFATVRRENLIVNVGMSIEINIEMVPEAIKEQITVTAPSPVVDITSSKIVQNISSDMMMSIPMARDVIGAIQLAPGVQERRVYGSSRNDTGFMVDGVHTNAPNNAYAAANISWETIEEVEFITGGTPPEAYHGQGGFMNIVTKSGGNDLSGSVIGYFTSEDFSKSLLRKEQLDVLGVGEPRFPILDYEMSGTLGGAIWRDKLWFFANVRHSSLQERGLFRPTTILGKEYGAYDYEQKHTYGYLKLTSQLAPNLRLSGMLNLWKRPNKYMHRNWFTTLEATRENIGSQRTGTALLNWVLDQNTFIDIRAGFWRHQSDIPFADESVKNNPRYVDSFTKYAWNGGTFERLGRKFTWSANTKVTRFIDDFLGDHELKTGVEFQYGNQYDSNYRGNSIQTWRFYNGNPYYYRGLYDLDGPHPTLGDGSLALTTLGPEEGDSGVWSKIYRIGGFIQDSWSPSKRLTIALGFRYDHVTGGMPALTDKAADSLAQAIGDTYFVPKYGFNPYRDLQYEAWDNAMIFNSFSPSLGFTYDLFGDGKTALKASIGRYPEVLITATWSGIHPVGGRTFNFRWWDLNNNGQPDAPPVDEYKHYGSSPLAMLSTLYEDRIDPDITNPWVDQLNVTLQHELTRDFKISASYVYKNWENIMGDVYYDLTSGRYWSKYEEAPEFWIPFTTTIPAYEDFPAQTVTMYFLSKDSPEQTTRLTNIPDAKRRYQAVEFSFNKRMSNGWQMGGSVVVSSLKGNYSLETTGYSWGSDFATPNFYVNNDGNLSNSRPLHIKLYGSYTLPWNFVVSFFYEHLSGTPWQRTVTVRPPAAWAAANNAYSDAFSINVEQQGSRWYEPQDNLDLRLEKQFRIGGRGMLAAFVDIFNVLGTSRLDLTLNPAGTWLPADANTTEGVYSLGWTGINNYIGVRTFRFSVRYSF